MTEEEWTSDRRMDRRTVVTCLLNIPKNLLQETVRERFSIGSSGCPYIY